MDHIEELNKIEKASKGFFRQGTRDALRMIRTFDPKINEIKNKVVWKKRKQLKYT